MKKLLLILVLLVQSTSIIAQEKTTTPNFKIEIKWNKNRVVIISDIYELSFSSNKEVVLNQFGMVNLKSNPSEKETSDFLFSYIKEGKKIILKGIKGVSWKELILDYKKEYTINYDGIVKS